MEQVELSKDELEVLGFYRTAKEGKEADLEISIKGGTLAKVFITNKKLYDKEGKINLPMKAVKCKDLFLKTGTGKYDVILRPVEIKPFQFGLDIPKDVSDGKIEELGKNLNSIITADQQIATYEQKMEEYAGAPKQAMGIRTPGEKTAFEVQQLENAAGRIFQEKVTQFEMMMVEPVLNLMLECARRNISAIDIARSFDDDFGVDMFLEITKEDITARGKLRPIGARHFGEQAQLLQNISQLFNGPLGQMIAPHVSPKALAYLVEDALNIHKYEVVRPNAGMVEQAEQKQMAGNLDQQVQEEQSVPI